MDLTFERLHWGDAPHRDINVSVVVGARMRPVGEVTALSYGAQKGGQPAIWRHRFERRPDDYERRLRGPYLLEADEDGDFLLAGVAEDSLSVGIGVDIELEDGPRILLSDCWVVTDAKGRYCQLGFAAEDVPWNLEQRGQHVTADGIEG